MKTVTQRCQPGLGANSNHTRANSVVDLDLGKTFFMKGNLFWGIFKNPKSHKYLIIIHPKVLVFFTVAVILLLVIYKLKEVN